MNKNNLYILKFSMADYCGDCEDDEERFYDQTSRRHCRLNVSERQMRRRRAAQRHQMSYTIDDLEQPADSSDDLPPPEPQELMLEDLPPPPQELMLEDLPQVMSENDDDDLEDYYSLVEEESATEDELCNEEDENDDDFYMEQLSVEERQNLFKSSLTEWVLDCNVTKTSVNKLLKVLRSQEEFSFLPSSYKTLIKTPRSVNLKTLGPGQYYHFGLEEAIIHCLESENADANSISSIRSIINTDGTSLSNSSMSEVWPLFLRLLDYHTEAIEISIYHGPTKPNNFNDFLLLFVEEAKHLMENGLVYRGQRLPVEILCFSCDQPALSSIKFCVLHTGYFSCMKCETEGDYVYSANGRGGRVTFPQIDAPLRTDESFRNQTQHRHHKGVSILQQLPISMVNSFTIDVMHLVFIGIMKKLLHIWFNCRKGIRLRLSKSDAELLSNLLEKTKTCIPSEFARKTRSLKELCRFKATELRLLLLYILPVLLSFFPIEIYNHFLLLHCAIRILCCPKLIQKRKNVLHAKSLLIVFVQHSNRLYGNSFIVSNVHYLIHLADEVLRFSLPLDVLGCSQFENKIQVLKNVVRPTHRPLAQLVKRILEKRLNPRPSLPHFHVQFGQKHHSAKEKRGQGSFNLLILFVRM